VPEITNLNDLEPVPLVRALLLALIRKTPGVSGYDLMKAVSEFTKGAIELSSGTVYTELRRLEKNNKLSSSRETTGRKRRVYSLTKQGEKELLHLIDQIKKRVEIVLNPLMEFVV
jgi:DNA-binding PadR family transcriptional regulator